MNTVFSGIQEPNFRFPLDKEFDSYLSQEMFLYTGRPYLGFSLQKFHPEILSQFKKTEFKKWLANLPVLSHTRTAMNE